MSRQETEKRQRRESHEAHKATLVEVERVPKSRKALDPAAREKQLSNLAMNLAEEQLRDGTASPSVITHFLKLASTREAIEREVLEGQKKLVDAKASSITSHSDSERTAELALGAFRKYQGNADDHDD